MNVGVIAKSSAKFRNYLNRSIGGGVSMNLDVYRLEEKYILTKLQAEKLYSKLKKLLPGDEYNGYEPYRVRSLYFDSYYNDDYFDKLDGVKMRKKIRLRTYSADSDTVKLEVKQKEGANQRKRSLKISREDAIKLTHSDIQFLREMDDELATSVYYIFAKEQYKPKTIVEYTRRAFQVPVNNIRITFDSDIDISEGNLNLFEKLESFLVPYERRDIVILEVKYNHFLLSYIKDAISSIDTTATSYSKYITGRHYSLY